MANDIVEALRQPYNGFTPQWNKCLMLKASDEIERLRAERDELRRLVCRADAERRGRAAQASGMSDWFYSPNQIAAEYGWDCFGVTKCRSPAAPTDKPTQEDTE